MRLASNRPATPTARVIRVSLSGEPFEYRAGQAASLALPVETERTPYSIASAPHETARRGELEFLVKVDGSSRFGARVSDLLPGTDIAVTGPMGHFVFPADARGTPLLFIAGGTGIAPLRSMIRHALDVDMSTDIALLYSARVPGEFAYLDELRELQRERRLSLSLTLTGQGEDWEHARGRAGAAHLADLLRPDTMCFICGPPAMVREVPEALGSLGVARARIKTEDW